MLSSSSAIEESTTLAIETKTSTTTSNNNDDNPHFQDMYFELIFAVDLPREVMKKLKEYSQPTFIEYLHTLQQQAKTNQEEEEYQGLEELLKIILSKKEEQREKEEEEEEEEANATTTSSTSTSSPVEVTATTTTTTTTTITTPLSNADIIKRANQIDKAVAAAALSDDEKPSDFISDCREVVNLSRKFNNRGQMKVGGG